MNLTVDDYGFGWIRIAGQEYTSDVVIYADRVDAKWWRREGHRLDWEDLAELLDQPPATLVIGTGYFGRMAVTAATKEALESRGIRIIAARTTEAVKEFNRLRADDDGVVAALHLTC